MDLNTYIKQNQLNPNPYILAQLGASKELISYLVYTPENTNLNVIGSIGESINADCNHPELGELMYCGNASNKAIIDANGVCDDGVQSEWCDMERWFPLMLPIVGHGTGGLVGVFDGNAVPARVSAESETSFGNYLTLSKQTNAETGDDFITVSALTGASHYAIYYCADCNEGNYYSTLGNIYYCGGLQSGTIANDDDGTADAGAIVTNAETWARAIYARNENKKMYLVSNGNILASTGGTDTNAEFGDTSIFVTLDAETGYYSAFAHNAPSHYAIYSEYTPEEYAPEP